MTLIDKSFRYAIVGASNDPHKYGNIVLKDLISAGFNAVPVNPKGEDILGLKTYRNLREIKGKIDVVIFLVPPEITEKILIEVKELGIDKVWMQPGSESDKAIGFCEKNKMEFIFGSCIMLEKNSKK